MAEEWERGYDAADPRNIPHRDDPVLVIGYIGIPGYAFNVWPDSAWAAFTGDDLLPTVVASLNGRDDGVYALAKLRELGVPDGAEVMYDLEDRVDRTLVENFGAEVHQSYKVLPYGSAGTIFSNPPLNGYAVASPTGIEHMYPHPGVRLTQWKFGPRYDREAVRPWLAAAGDWWRLYHQLAPAW